MQIIADFHIHSRFARACSKQITLENLEKYARIKGINLLGTGDFTHPSWFREIKENLQEDDNGILWSKSKFPFIWQTEISLMYSQDGKGRRVHHVILAPNGECVEQLIDILKKKGRIDYDGRPIFGFSSIEFVDMLIGISKDFEIIPAHAWTPWFGIFGSKSGFDSVEECFKERSKFIHAFETGMSSDPAMNWRLSKLDKYIPVSFSDMHSFWPWRIGREATVFDTEINYKAIINALRTRQGLKATIETDPNYGKYHFDGHRNCDASFSPDETRKLNGICPRCRSALTIGVLNRVEQLADREEGYTPENTIPFKKLIPLSELISAVYGFGLVSSRKVWEIYNKLINQFGNEYEILLNADERTIAEASDEKLAKVVMQNREGKIKIKPGYDGVYGVPVIEGREVKIEGDGKVNEKTVKKQKGLDEFM